MRAEREHICAAGAAATPSERRDARTGRPRNGRVSAGRPCAGSSAPSRSDVAVGTGPGARPDITITEEPFDGADSVRLRGEVSAELRRRYGSDDRSEGDPGAAAWAHDVAGFLIARGSGGEPVGCVALRRLHAGVFELKRMYVRPAARGRRIADALLSAAERMAVERGARRLILQTGTEQPEAITVYCRNGYEPIAPFGEFADSPRSRCFGRDLR